VRSPIRLRPRLGRQEHFLTQRSFSVGGQAQEIWNEIGIDGNKTALMPSATIPGLSTNQAPKHLPR
jgi:hypothetical protein